MIWHTTRFAIDLSRPRIMGIVNVRISDQRDR